MLIIPAIDIQDGKCVRLTQGRQGTTTVYSDNPVEMARHWADQGARRLHVVDLDGAFSGKPLNKELIRRIIQSAEIPVQVGGGIRSIEIGNYYIESGAHSVIFGSKVVKDPNFIKTAIKAFPEKVVVGIDARKGRLAVEGWTETSEETAIEFTKRMVSLGVQEVIYTDIDRDGMLTGPNIPSIRKLARAVKVSVIASGGVSQLEDIRSLMALESDGVSGVIIGKALYSGSINLKEALLLTYPGKRKC